MMEGSDRKIPTLKLDVSTPQSTTPRHTLWSSAFGVTLYIVLLRVPIAVILLFTILFTNSTWWQENQLRFGSAVLWQQVLTAFVGLLISLLMRDAAWMVQGAIAAVWSFRKKGMPLPVCEAIQDANPMLIFMTSTSATDKAMILFIPLMVVMLNITYKFGITVAETTEPWDGIMRTNLMGQFGLDRRRVAFENCTEEYAYCKQKHLDEIYGVKLFVPDLDDYTFMDGVQRGGRSNSSATAYELDVGDVPSVYGAFKLRMRAPMVYTQVFMQSRMDCGRTSANPWTLEDCLWVTGPDQVPARDGSTDMDVQDFRVCAPYVNSTIQGVVTFFEDTLDLSCKFNISVSLRKVSATRDVDTWKVKPLEPEVPIGSDVLWANRVGFLYWSPRSLSSYIDKNAGTACYAQGSVCNGKNQKTLNYELEIASRVISSLTGWTYQFLQSNRDPMPENEELLIPFDGRKFMPNNTTEWFPIVGPRSILNVTALPNSHFIIGAFASTQLLRTSYVCVQYWMLAFISLLLIQIIAAKFKIRYQCHPLESVGGLVWTLRKVDPGVARDVQGLKLSELLDYSSRLKLERKSGDGSTVIRRMTVAEINERSGTAPRSASRSSALVFEPPPFDEGRDHFMIPGFGQGGVGANGRNGIHVGRDTYVASPQTYSPNRTGYTELRESISIDDDHSRLPAARPT